MKLHSPPFKKAIRKNTKERELDTSSTLIKVILATASFPKIYIIIRIVSAAAGKQFILKIKNLLLVRILPQWVCHHKIVQQGF